MINIFNQNYPKWIEVVLEDTSTLLIDRKTGVFFKICYESASCTFMNENGLQWVYNENGVTVTDPDKALEVQKGQWIKSGVKDFVIRTFTSDEVLLRARDYFLPLAAKERIIETGKIFLN